MSVGLFAIVGFNQTGHHLVRRGWELIAVRSLAAVVLAAIEWSRRNERHVADGAETPR